MYSELHKKLKFNHVKDFKGTISRRICEDSDGIFKFMEQWMKYW